MHLFAAIILDGYKLVLSFIWMHKQTGSLSLSNEMSLLTIVFI